jgi:hypothetical protein
MSAAENKPAGPGAKDAYIELAERIFVNLAARVYSAPSAPDQKKPDPKILAAMSFKMADAFEAAARETDRAKAAIEIANKAAVKLDEVDLSSVFAGSAKK